MLGDGETDEKNADTAAMGTKLSVAEENDRRYRGRGISYMIYTLEI